MAAPSDLLPAERALLRAALDGPLEVQAATLELCRRLCGRKLLQRAGPLAVHMGWRGSPNAFTLTREGWAFLKAERRRPLRRAG
jgi:hypothetical protein